jgi:hypothetical protein
LEEQEAISEVNHLGKRRPLKLRVLLWGAGVKASIGKLYQHILITIGRLRE